MLENIAVYYHILSHVITYLRKERVRNRTNNIKCYVIQIPSHVLKSLRGEGVGNGTKHDSTVLND